MSFKNFLDLRKKSPQQIKIVERIILQKRSIKSDIFLTLSVIFVATGVIWGISKADNVSVSTNNIQAFRQMLDDRGIPKEERISLGTRGDVSSINNKEIVLTNANNRMGEKGFTYTVDISHSNFKSNTGSPLTQFDIELNQKVIAKGIIVGNTLLAHTLIIFKDETLPTATTTATTTLDISTNTETISTTSEENSTSTPSFVDKLKDTISDIVDGIIGTDTATTTETETTEEIIATSTATTTEEQVTEEATTTTEEKTTEQATSTSIIDTVTDAITNITDVVTEAISNVTDIITGDTSEPTPETTPELEQTNTEQI